MRGFMFCCLWGGGKKFFKMHALKIIGLLSPYFGKFQWRNLHRISKLDSLQLAKGTVFVIEIVFNSCTLTSQHFCVCLSCN